MTFERKGAFDQATRGRLQKLVNSCRSLLSDEFSIQLQQTYGLDPKTGEVTPMARLTHLDDRQCHTAEVLRQTLAHYLGADADDTDHRIAVLDRMVREQAFTVLNRMAALLMMEARGQLIESVSKGYQSRGYQLYSKIAGTALGETGQAYQVYLFSIFDELAQELPALFDRYAANGLLFPCDTALRALLDDLNHFEIEPLWAADETIGWIYQYFNSKEERKAMRDASQAPRNSRELAVRNQFFTPRYVVEFLVDNTLGRLWFNATGGQTDLRDRCQYLLVKSDEQAQFAIKLRDPRTLKLLDPACGSMHFGLYAFDLFAEIYREAWAWEQQHGPGSLDVSTQPQVALKPLCQTYEDEAAFARDVPRLIIENNIYGVDIDPRAAQIASLALWLRAQRAWHDAGVKAKDRPRIGQGHVVAAVAPPAEKELRLQFAAQLDQRDAELFEKTLQMLKRLPELGVLLQVERELQSLIEKVYGKNIDLFNDLKKAKTWALIESDLRLALVEFSQFSKSSYQVRLFAQDALQALRLIDLCREQFDVVVMNPPFGACSIDTRELVARTYPSAKGDLLAVFVERSIELLRRGGRVGAITNRSCLFLTSMEEWRDKVVLAQTSPETLADLGAGVMDDAMVEAAAYVLRKKEKVEDESSCICIRVLTENNKSDSLLKIIGGGDAAKVFSVQPASFLQTPSHAFTYWVPSTILQKLFSKSSIEQKLVRIRVGMQTGDDGRFLRQWWEVDARKLFPIRGVSDTRGEAREAALSSHGGWFTYTKTDEASPWFSPLLQVINWKKSGYEYKNFLDKNGKSRAALRSQEFYLQPGFSYMNRSSRLVPYVFPAGAIPSAGRSQAFGDGDDLFDAYVIAASNVGSACARFTGEKFAWPKFQAGMIQSIPSIQVDGSLRKQLREKITKEYVSCRQRFELEEPYREFLLPAFLVPDRKEFVWNKESLLGSDLELKVATEYGLTNDEFASLDRDLQEAVAYQSQGSDVGDDDDTSCGDTEEYAAEKNYRDLEGLVSYAVGCVFGRWDIRVGARGYKVCTDVDPFSPLPLSPPGMLKDTEGLPVSAPQVDLEYPIEICKTGIMQSDMSMYSELVSYVRAAFDVVSILRRSDESVICSGLKCRVLEEYLHQPTKFFADHLTRYTAGGRKAPIYWPLSTVSGGYTLWVYYPSLNNQTLFTAVNDFLDGPNGKLTQVSRECAELRIKGSGRSRDEEKQYETLQTFEQELTHLRDTLLKIAPTYQPNHDDGVQITAAPLWQLFRYKPWQKVLKDTWTKLEKGDYDWAHLAMAYWPERVREKCKTDKSLAIAHGLEELYVEPEAALKKARGKKKTGADE
ncbi:BREX-1 system adenine-specific DNA-methyltransferase PglX [Pseudomonas sp.]|uniref:BREX-1 system adenine-specific DNA-methyltransferase PglX n=1 Tax=Pseudomonas sp. TaxID=306 RepID=UPI0023548B82|nr:BREX-1 system adenine-specific DNA-methyltransferase PglX [Pseudomonas sp.]